MALPLLPLAAMAALAQACCTPENRVWKKFAQNTQMLLCQPPQLLESHKVKALPR
jgi:hypothetical protein